MKNQEFLFNLIIAKQILPYFEEDGIEYWIEIDTKSPNFSLIIYLYSRLNSIIIYSKDKEGYDVYMLKIYQIFFLGMHFK